jgi:hypothetical protein
MLLPLVVSPLADTPSARADAFLGRLARFTLADWARAWCRFDECDLVVYAAARTSLAAALPGLADDALVERTRVAACAVTGWLPIADQAGWRPADVRALTVYAVLAALCVPLLTADEVDALTAPFRAATGPANVVAYSSTGGP